MSSPHCDAVTSEHSVPVRLIARLDIKGPNVIKGIHLEGLRKIGEPNEIANRYYADGVDEILFMDSVASLYGRNNILPVVSEAAKNVFVPLTVGGGVRNVEDIRDILRSGADKVSINTAAVKDPSFLKRAARIFGSQCIVLSIEAKRTGLGGWEAMTDCGRERTGLDVIDWVRRAQDEEIGEILVTSIDAEGTRNGFDLDLVREVSNAVTVPVVASGGAGSAAHAHALFSQTRVDAAAFASIFHYGICGVGELKKNLAASGTRVRLS